MGCHSKGIVHRDVKAENVLLTERWEDPAKVVPTAQLCDFGMAARCLEEQTLEDTCGSPDYVAPEVVKRQPYRLKVDTWSAGVLLFVCLRGRTPFSGRSDGEVLRNVV